MMVELLIALVRDDFGAAGCLRIAGQNPPSGREGNLLPAPADRGWLHDLQAEQSVAYAREFVESTIGWPTGVDVYWSVEGYQGHPIPPIAGPSLFGAFCLGLMQFAVCERSTSFTKDANEHLATVRDTGLSKAAISAAFAEDKKSFVQVGHIEKKLQELANLRQDCALCLVSSEQKINLPLVGPSQTSPRSAKTGTSLEFYWAGKLKIAVARAADPVDAFNKLFHLQSEACVLSALSMTS
jgi:hypothetical protein